jgi:hypothetical protein
VTLSSYAEFGVFINSIPAPSKVAIKRALKDAPDTIVWQEIGTIGNDWRERPFTTAELLAEGFSTLVLVGPNPYTDRRWYGSLTPKGDGVKLA